MVRGVLILLAWLGLAGGAFAAGHASNECIELKPDAVFAATMLDAKAAAPSGRVALVIGNGAYGAVARLPNPANDAQAVAERLQALGFATFLLIDGDDAHIKACAAAAEQRMANTDIALFYYAGHGIQVDDDNYLIGVNAQPGLADNRGLVRAADITRRFSAGAKTALVFLDACRSNPLAADQEAGLAIADARVIPVTKPGDLKVLLPGMQPTGIMVTYATSPNATAADGSGAHSPFTQAFLAEVGQPGHSIQQSISQIGKLVGEATDYQQTPWSRSSLTSLLYLNGAATKEQAIQASSKRAAEAFAAYQKGDGNTALELSLEGFPSPLGAADLASFADARTMLLHSLSQDTVALDIAKVKDVSFSPDGSRIATLRESSGEIATLELWDAHSRQKLAELATGSIGFQSDDLIFSADSRRLLWVTGDYLAQVWQAEDGALIRALDHPGGKGTNTNVRLNRDGSLLMAQDGGDDFLAIVDVDTGKVRSHIRASDIGQTVNENGYYPNNAGYSSRAFFVDDRPAVVITSLNTDCSGGLEFVALDLATGRLSRSPSTGPLAQSCDVYPRNISADGTRIMVARSNDGNQVPTAMVFDIATAKMLFSKTEHDSHLWWLTPDGKSAFVPAYIGGERTYYPVDAGSRQPSGTVPIVDEGAMLVTAKDPYPSFSGLADVPRWKFVPQGVALIDYSLALLPPDRQAEVAAGRVKWFPLPGMDQAE